MSEEWKAYSAGIFNEFMEQRTGAYCFDDKIYRKGMLDFIADIQRARSELGLKLIRRLSKLRPEIV